MMNGTRMDEISRNGETTPAPPIYGAFRETLRRENGTDYLPPKVEDALYAKAYEMGHSGGYAEVETVYGDLAELVITVCETYESS